MIIHFFGRRRGFCLDVRENRVHRKIVEKDFTVKDTMT